MSRGVFHSCMISCSVEKGLLMPTDTKEVRSGVLAAHRPPGPIAEALLAAYVARDRIGVAIVALAAVLAAYSFVATRPGEARRAGFGAVETVTAPVPGGAAGAARDIGIAVGIASAPSPAHGQAHGDGAEAAKPAAALLGDLKEAARQVRALGLDSTASARGAVESSGDDSSPAPSSARSPSPPADLRDATTEPVGPTEGMSETSNSDAAFRAEVSFRIVDGDDAESGFWRAETKEGPRQYFVVVEAVSDGKAMDWKVKDSDTGRMATVPRFALRVDEDAFARVAEDKRDDGRIDMSEVGIKPSGHGAPAWTISTTGETITEF